MPVFVHRITYPGTGEDFRARVVPEVVVPALGKGDWFLADLADQHARFERAYRSAWVLLACVLLFPVGLLALLAPKTTQRLSFSWTASGAGLDVVISAEGPRSLRRYVERIDGDRLHAAVTAAAVS